MYHTKERDAALDTREGRFNESSFCEPLHVFLNSPLFFGQQLLGLKREVRGRLRFSKCGLVGKGRRRKLMRLVGELRVVMQEGLWRLGGWCFVFLDLTSSDGNYPYSCQFHLLKSPRTHELTDPDSEAVVLGVVHAIFSRAYDQRG